MTFTLVKPTITPSCGEVAEWLIAHAWKACVPSKGVQRVQIPPSPPVVFCNVQEHVALAPNVPDEQGDLIVQTLQQNGQFPPASIVFGIQLFPYRAMKAPQGYRVLEMAVTPRVRGRAAAGAGQFPPVVAARSHMPGRF